MRANHLGPILALMLSAPVLTVLGQSCGSANNRNSYRGGLELSGTLSAGEYKYFYYRSSNKDLKVSFSLESGSAEVLVNGDLMGVDPTYTFAEFRTGAGEVEDFYICLIKPTCYTFAIYGITASEFELEIEDENKGSSEVCAYQYTTAAPTTAAPTTVAPTTAAPTTAAPTTAAPTTAAPTTAAPTTAAPTTAAPTTAAPTTAAPTTAAPTTAAPTTEAPTTAAPTAAAPTTEAPTTAAPTTAAPTTEAPTTEAPTTEAPTTEAPTTEAPTTEAPTTEAPTTAAPTTEAPTTPAPETAAPSVVETAAPSVAETAAPSVAETLAPTVEETLAPTSVNGTATEAPSGQNLIDPTAAPSNSSIPWWIIGCVIGGAILAMFGSFYLITMVTKKGKRVGGRVVRRITIPADDLEL